MKVRELFCVLILANPDDDVFIGANVEPLADVDIVCDPPEGINPYLILKTEKDAA